MTPNPQRPQSDSIRARLERLDRLLLQRYIDQQIQEGIRAALQSQEDK